MASDIEEMPVGVLFPDSDRLPFEGIDDNSVGKVIFEACCVVTYEKCADIDSSDIFVCVPVEDGEKC